MKNLLKYLIPVLVIATFFSAAGRSGSSSQGISSGAFSTEDLAFAESLSSPASDFSVPIQISSGTLQLQNCARRTVNVHTRPLLEVIKSGKAHNISVAYSVQRKSVIINTSIVEHSHKLVCLGKLII